MTQQQEDSFEKEWPNTAKSIVKIHSEEQQPEKWEEKIDKMKLNLHLIREHRDYHLSGSVNHIDVEIDKATKFELKAFIAKEKKESEREVFEKLIANFKKEAKRTKTMFPKDALPQAIIKTQIQFLKDSALEYFKIKIK